MIALPRLLKAASLVVLCCLAIAARADPFTITNFSFTAGTAGTSSYQNASGTITAYDDGTVVITITNNLLNSQVISVGQNVSGLYFTASTLNGPGSILNSTGTLIGISSSGASVDNQSTIGWAFANNIVINGELGSAVCVICQGMSAPATPGQTIIGWDGGNSYVNANGSIVGNDPHNPFLAQTATFTLNMPGVTSATQFTNITVQFGTTALTTVPDSSSWSLLIISGLGIGGLLKRYRMRG